MNIVTVTINPAFDVHCGIESFLPERENHMLSCIRDAGGKGINVSAVIIIIENEANKIGLIVDAVNEVLTIPPKQIMESTKEKNDLKESFVNGISQINNDIQLILDCDSLVNIVGDMSNEINE